MSPAISENLPIVRPVTEEIVREGFGGDASSAIRLAEGEPGRLVGTTATRRPEERDVFAGELDGSSW
jgi:hypothetical protein